MEHESVAGPIATIANWVPIANVIGVVSAMALKEPSLGSGPGCTVTLDSMFPSGAPAAVTP